MFAACGVTGQVFRGTLEEMNRVRGLVQSRSPLPSNREEVNLLVESFETQAARPSEKALRAYRAKLPRELERGPLYHAGQIMQRKVVCVGVNDKIEKAWKFLRSHKVKHAPVIDDATQVVGTLSEHDLLTTFNIDTGKIVELFGRRVGEVMRTPVITAEAVTDVRRIATAMLENSIDGVPVTGDFGRLVGYVSRSDILRAVVADPPLSLWR
jgi:CBS-domain-containing membrane protein